MGIGIHTIGSEVCAKYFTTRENILDPHAVQDRSFAHAKSCGTILGEFKFPTKTLYAYTY